MTKSPVFWGAGLACALGGAVAGSALGSTPILDRSTLTQFYTAHDGTGSAASAHETPPDHYPLVTRAGTVPVAELGQRGLYSQARYRAAYPTDEHGDLAYEDHSGSLPPDFESEPAPALAARAGREGDLGDSEAAPPLQLAMPADVEQQDGAKLIDVAATLAMR